MYATCLFCNNALGANEALEHFPVGRRIAYDEAKGRLWVVCRTCERWNLSPLETRWEAIEEAEKAFRTTRMRVVSDNISMAQLSEGLELVRIGSAERPEFAAWRYGDQFGRRHRKYRRIGMGVFAASLPHVIWSVGNIAGDVAFPGLKALLMSGSLLGGAASVIGSTTLIGYLTYHNLITSKIPRLTIRDDNGELLRLTPAVAGAAALFPANRNGDWFMSVKSVTVQPATGLAKQLGYREMVLSENAPRNITGAAALRALGKMLPTVNMLGGKKQDVQDAVKTINDAPDIQHILRHGGFPDPKRERMVDFEKHRYSLATFQPHFRLALEMALHESDERRAMEGELKELEQRWREADAIAKISDEMFFPSQVDARVHELRGDAVRPNESSAKTDT